MGRVKKPKKEAIQPLPSPSRQDFLASILLSALTLIVYGFTAAPGVTLADSADFITGVLTLGIVHPPGYPLYTVLGYLFSFLPFGDAAFRVNLFSSLWGSLGLGIMFLILRMLSVQPIHAVFTTLLLGFTTVFWSKTAVAGVYSFNGFLIACTLFWILKYNSQKRKTYLHLLFLTTGLALSNHYPLVVLSGLGLVFLLDRRGLRAGDFIKGLLFLALGLTPYLYLFIQASNPELQYNFGKLSDPGMVLDHILRKYYANVYGGTLRDKLLLAVTLAKAVATNFGVTSPFILFGITVSLLKKLTFRYPLLLAALSPSVGLILILTFPNDDHNSALLLDYLIPTFLFLSVFLAIGLQEFLNRYLKTVQVPLLVILLSSQIALNFRTSSHHNDNLAEIWGTELLHSLKPSSILILCGPGQFPVHYLQLVRGLRPDVTLYDRFSFWTKENLYAPALLFKRTDAIEYRKKREQELINHSERPVYYTCKEPLDEQKTDFSFTPFALRADKRHSEAPNATVLKVSDRLLEALVNGYPQSEHWLDQRRRNIFSRLISYYAPNPPEVTRIVEYLKRSRFYSDPQFLLSLANNAYYFENNALATQFYERAEDVSSQAFSPTDLAVFCYLLANGGKYDKALPVCTRHEQASAPCATNTLTVQQTIAAIHKEHGNWSKVAEYSRKIIQCQPNHEIAQRYLKWAMERAN